ncbi:hypothetical protein M9458_047025, partial [Cirrhinus mrigala]
MKLSLTRMASLAELQGNPPTDTGQQVIKLGPAHTEVRLKAAVIQAQLLEELVKLIKLGAPLKNLMDPDTVPNESTPFFGLPYYRKRSYPCNKINVSHFAMRLEPPGRRPSHDAKSRL